MEVKVDTALRYQNKFSIKIMNDYLKNVYREIIVLLMLYDDVYYNILVYYMYMIY